MKNEAKIIDGCITPDMMLELIAEVTRRYGLAVAKAKEVAPGRFAIYREHHECGRHYLGYPDMPDAIITFLQKVGAQITPGYRHDTGGLLQGVLWLTKEAAEGAAAADKSVAIGIVQAYEDHLAYTINRIRKEMTPGGTAYEATKGFTVEELAGVIAEIHGAGFHVVEAHLLSKDTTPMPQHQTIQ